MYRQNSTNVDLAIQNVQAQIDALNELKSCIVADVVTGKIDVRDIEIPEYEHVDEEPDSDVEDVNDEEDIEEQED